MRITIIMLFFILISCVTRTPVVIVCEPPDEKLIIPLMFPMVETNGELEDELVRFVRETLPADNARKTELQNQIKKMGER